jgi:[acyl-carrier-protein] S-malonyltransferase
MVDWTATAFLFPGQASQAVGMGSDIAEAYPAARQTFEQADDLLGFSLSHLCFAGPEEELNQTLNTQPALYVCSMATLRVLQQERPDAVPGFAAGHSFGEITALAAVGALAFEDGLRLTRERGRVMTEAGEQNPGAMAAILGLDADAVRDLCARVSKQTGKALVLANDNCPGQIVISGDLEAVEIGLVAAREAGAKRALKLAVSIAAHSPLMVPAAEQFHTALANTPFESPAIPVYGNVEAAPLGDATHIRRELEVQLTSPVRWTDSVRAMIAAGAEAFVEIGPKDVLSGLLRRIDGAKPSTQLNSTDNLRRFVQSA